MKKPKYLVVLFCNNKRHKILYRCNKRSTINKYWEKIKNDVPPKFVKLQGGKRDKVLNYEVGLIYPFRKLSKTIWKKDELGRSNKVIFESETYSLKALIPYWEEELIYDYTNKKRIKYDQLVDIILTYTSLTQIFILNNKLFVQNDNDVRLFSNKNINDAERLLVTLRTDLIRQNKGNFLFIKDINTRQRKNLYDMLIEKGFSRTELFRHYSY
jgi:hypothetical protein